jgi:hypothetical protein
MFLGGVVRGSKASLVAPALPLERSGRRMGELAVELLIEETRQPSCHPIEQNSGPGVIPRRSALHSREDTSESEGTHVAHMVGTAHSP